MNTKSRFDWLLRFTSDRRREVLCDCCGTGRAIPTSEYSRSNVKLHSSFSPSKFLIPSVLLTLSLPFHVLLPSSSVKEQKGTFGRKSSHSCFTKTLSFITEEAAVNTILTYKTSQQKDHSLIPACWM